MSDISYLIKVDSAGAVTSIKNFEGALDATGKAGEGAHPKIKTFNDTIANSGNVGGAVTTKIDGLWKQIVSGQMAYDLVKKAGQAFMEFLSSSIKSAGEAEKADSALDSALALTGRTVSALSSHYREYAASLQRATRYGDEEIKNVQTLLIQLTNLDKNGVDRATRGTIGLASALKIDLQSAAMLVAKAVEGNTTALGRYGIEVDETLKGDEKRAAILEKLEGYYKRATDETNTFTGRSDQLKNTLDELKETIGKTVTNSDALKKSMGLLRGVIEDLNTVASAGGTNWIDMLLGKLSASVPIFRMLITSIENETLKLRLEAAEIEYNERVYKGLKIALVEFDKILMSHGVDIEKITGGLIRHKKVVNETGAATKATTKTYQAVPTALRILAGELTNTLLPMSNLAFTSTAVKLALYDLGIQATTSGVQLGESLVPSNATAKLERLRAIMGYISPEWKKHLEEMETESQKKMQRIFDVTKGVVSGLDAIFTQANTNRMIQIDNEYNSRKKAILAMQIDEVKKNAMLENLDKEFEVKRRTAQRAYAKEQKAMAVFNSIIGTAEGVVNALKVPPAPNIFLGILMGALGAARTAFIAAQPLPLAKGAVFTQPTRMMTDKGGYYEVGEAGTEVLAPLHQIPAIANQMMGGRAARRSERVTPLHVHLSIDKHEIKEVVLRIVQDAAGIHKLNLQGANF